MLSGSWFPWVVRGTWEYNLQEGKEHASTAKQRWSEWTWREQYNCYERYRYDHTCGVEVLLPHGLSPGCVVSKTTSPSSGYQTGRDSSYTTFAYTIYIRKHTTPFASATIMGRLGCVACNFWDFWKWRLGVPWGVSARTSSCPDAICTEAR